jgi:hypothetical protein
VPSIVAKRSVAGLEPPPKYNGTARSARTPELSKKIKRLAEQLAAQILERELSMASLQGYFTSYKTRPFQGVDGVERWAQEAQEAQDQRAEARIAANRGRS